MCLFVSFEGVILTGWPPLLFLAAATVFAATAFFTDAAFAATALVLIFGHGKPPNHRLVG